MTWADYIVLLMSAEDVLVSLLYLWQGDTTRFIYWFGAAIVCGVTVFIR